MKNKLMTCNVYSILLFVFSVLLLLSCQKQEILETIAPINVPFEMPQPQRPIFADKIYNITDFGAKNDSIALTQNAIQSAIDQCSASGGGKVIIPGGTWITGPIKLKSNVNLHLEKDGLLLFTIEKSYYYDEPNIAFDGDPRAQISAHNCENIAITGEGTIDGQGIGWWPLQDQWWAGNKEHFGQEIYEQAIKGLSKDRIHRHKRPRIFMPVNCKNILLEGVTFKDSPTWNIHMIVCENIIIRRVTVTAAASPEFPDTPNTDGINPDACKNVLIEHCLIDTGDDSFAIKSGRDEKGRARGIASENIVIRHCQASRIAIGSEMSGGVKNVFVEHCQLSNIHRDVISLKTRRGRGGIMENIWFENITIGEVLDRMIYIDMEYYTHRYPAPYEPVSERTPQIRNIHLKNISGKCDSVLAIYVNGLPEMPIRNITFENIDLECGRAIFCENAQNIQFNNTSFSITEGPVAHIDSCQNVSFNIFNFTRGISPFLELRNKKTENIEFNNSLSSLRDDIILSNKARIDAIIFRD